MSYRMTSGRTKPNVNIEHLLNLLDPYTSDGTPKDPDHHPVFQSILEFVVGKPIERRVAHYTESLTISASDALYHNGHRVGTGTELEALLRDWWAERGCLDVGTYGPRAFQSMLDNTIGYQDGARRITIKDFLK